MKSLVRDLYYLARETVGAISEGIALGLKIVRDETEPGRDQIIHGPAWLDHKQTVSDEHIGTLEMTPPMVNGAYHFPWPPQTASTDGAGQVPAVECSPAAAASATDAAAGHPSIDLALDPNGDYKLAWVAAWGLRAFIAGDKCTAPTYFASIADDLEQLSK